MSYTFVWKHVWAPAIETVAVKGEAMADEEQLAILRQGVDAWNRWREKNSDTKTYLSQADLSRANLNAINLSETDLSYAKLIRANLQNANLIGANLIRADLTRANISDANLGRAHIDEANFTGAILTGANLVGIQAGNANFSEVDLINADLSYSNLHDVKLCKARLQWAILRETDLRNVDLSWADLSEANLDRVKLTGSDLSNADLSYANLSGAILKGSNFFNTVVGSSVFGNSDLSETRGLEYAIHHGPSRITTDVLANSRGKIPEIFLRGCGLSDVDIEFAKISNPALSNEEINRILYRIYDLRASKAIQISPLFISYCHADSSFVDKLERHLNKQSIRFWRDIHSITAGRLEKQIDRAIRQNPTVLLILSTNSIKSDWVEHEVRTARDLEKDMGRDTLCPIALDDTWKSSPWPKRVMEQVMEFNILDFSEWKDDSKFEGMFRRLVDGLELFYKG